MICINSLAQDTSGLTSSLRQCGLASSGPITVRGGGEPKSGITRDSYFLDSRKEISSGAAENLIVTC